MTMASDEGDLVAWAEQQTRLLCAGRFEALDVEHRAEEIEDLGKSETGIGFGTLPADCPWTAAEVLETGFWPGARRAPPRRR